MLINQFKIMYYYSSQHCFMHDVSLSRILLLLLSIGLAKLQGAEFLVKIVSSFAIHSDLVLECL